MEKLDEIVKIQCLEGNWNYLDYMRGMANGLLLAQAILKDTAPVYLDMPDQFLCEKPDAEELPPGLVGA